jgi:hypothetical protein
MEVGQDHFVTPVDFAVTGSKVKVKGIKFKRLVCSIA